MSRSQIDRLLIFALRTSALISGVIVALILGFLFFESVPAFNAIGLARFVTDVSWYPAEIASEGTFSLLPMLVGTLGIAVGACLLAAPLGIASALFCNYYAPPTIRTGYRRIIELLAGVPSVVYGFWGLVTLVPIITMLAPPGASMLAGILILSFMVLPTAALVSDAAFTAVPTEQLQAAASLGLSRWATIRAVVLPSAKSGLCTGIVLQVGRALGETMAVLMVCGNVVRMPNSIFDPVRTLTSNIALEMAYAMGDHRSSLFVSAAMLMLLVLALVAVADKLGGEYAYS